MWEEDLQPNLTLSQYKVVFSMVDNAVRKGSRAWVTVCSASYNIVVKQHIHSDGSVLVLAASCKHVRPVSEMLTSLEGKVRK